VAIHAVCSAVAREHEQIEPAVVIVVDPGDPAAGCFNDVLLRNRSAVREYVRHAKLFRDVLKARLEQTQGGCQKQGAYFRHCFAGFSPSFFRKSENSLPAGFCNLSRMAFSAAALSMSPALRYAVSSA